MFLKYNENKISATVPILSTDTELLFEATFLIFKWT